ncbi:hypothetical protein D3Z55_23125 [Clostridiaceae bacterium]|nr:hypothetical protein [Clostridiaceae bacterium]
MSRLRLPSSTEIEASRNLNEFNMMLTEWGICLPSTRIDETSNEILEMQKVIKQIDCRGCVVTADAMNTQKATAQAIAKEVRGEHYLVLKENQTSNGLKTEKNGIHNLVLIRRFVMFIIKLLKAYYHRSMKRFRNKIGRNLETEILVILAVLKVLYDNDMLDAIDELTK